MRTLFPKTEVHNLWEIAAVLPRQLVPSMGSLCAGVMASATPTLKIFDSMVHEEPICFGSFTFTLHLRFGLVQHKIFEYIPASQMGLETV
jgi:hypothetical protein